MTPELVVVLRQAVGILETYGSQTFLPLKGRRLRAGIPAVVIGARPLRMIVTLGPIIAGRRPVRFTPLLRRRLLSRWRPVVRWVTLRIRIRHQQRRAKAQPAEPSSELESQFHCAYIDRL